MVGLRALPPLASQNAMPALSGAIPSAGLPSRISARPYEMGAKYRPQHGQAVLPTQPLTFFGALAQVLVRHSGDRTHAPQYVSANPRSKG